MSKKIDVTKPGGRVLLNSLMFSLLTTLMLFTSKALATPGGSNPPAELGNLADMLQTWMSGELGMLILMVGLLVAVIMVVARASLMPVLFVLGLAIILGWGPAIFGAILRTGSAA